MSWFTDLSNPSKIRDANTKPLNEKWQRAGQKSVADAAKSSALERIRRAGESYTGDLVAGMSGAEQTSMDDLTKYLASSPATDDPMFQGAERELTDTLGGQTYDPVGGTYYQAYRNAVQRELRNSQNALAGRTSAGDNFFGGGRIKAEGELQEGATNTLALELGRLSEAERQRRLDAVEPAAAMTQYKEQAPLARIAAAQELGALPRNIEQAELDAAYVEWNRQLEDLGVALDVYTGMLTYVPPTAIGPSTAQQISEGFRSVGSFIGSIKGMGGGNAAASSPQTPSSGSNSGSNSGTQNHSYGY